MSDRPTTIELAQLRSHCAGNKVVSANVVEILVDEISYLKGEMGKALEQLRSWDGANAHTLYSDQFVWKANDILKEALREKKK